ncbi:MAG: autotransporter outer membrane beta-barrel domain-containing protein, partial [Planctomycetes bacterium]|nr:autotransporter outer membrane beta-barrel domain-containing protein [Planctomycetota bacterium]
MRRFLTIGSVVLVALLPRLFAVEPTLETEDWSVFPYAYDGQVTADGSGDNIVLPEGTVIAVDGGVPGSLNYAALYATNDGSISLTGGSLSLTNVESVGAATVDTGGYINLDRVNIVTYDTPGGRWQTGLMARTDGSIDFANGEITTMGNFGHGVHALNGGSITVNNSRITVSGNSAAGVYVGIDSSVTLTDSDILATSSDEGYGLYAIYSGATITMTNGTLTTEGSSPTQALPAVYGRMGATITLNTVAVTTRGAAGASGLMARETGTVVTMNGGSITTVGADAYGAFAIQGGRVELEDVAIRTSGDRSHGLWVWDGSSGELNGGSIAVDGTKNAVAVLTSGTGTVTGQGQYDISGDIRNDDDGSITLDFQPGSVFRGGTDVGDGTIDFRLTDATWYMDKSSTLTSLDITGGSIRYRTGSGYATLTTDTLSGGGGVFALRTDVGGDGGGVNNRGDLLVVTGSSSGGFGLMVTDTGSGKTTGDERLTVVKTADGIAQFALVNGEVDIGAYVFGLRRVPEDPTDWELYSDGEKTNPGTETPGLLTNTAYRIAFVEHQTLRQRLGEL